MSCERHISKPLHRLLARNYMGMASPFIFVLSLVCVSRVLAALECPEETAGSGPSYELVPVSPSDSVHMLMTASADEARNTAVCHATCVNYIFESQGSPNGSNGTAPTNGTSGTDSSTVPMEVGHGMTVCAINLWSL